MEEQVLVLTRKIGEGITIGDDIKVVVMQIKGKQVRLGIKASPGTAVHREEVYARIQDENRLASKSSPDSLIRAGDILKRKAPSKNPEASAKDSEAPPASNPDILVKKQSSEDS